MREILEALLTREGHTVRLAADAAEGLELARTGLLRRRDRRHHDAGHGRHDRARRAEEDRRRPAGADDYRVRVGRERHHGDETWRVSLHHQAVQERRSARRRAQRARAAPPGRRESRAAPEPAASCQPVRRDHRSQHTDEAGLRLDHAGGAEPDHDSDQRRKRHRQGAGRARPSSELGPRRQGVHHRQLRQSPAGSARIEPLRPREGRLHRRDLSEERPFRARRQGNDLFRRDWQHPARDPGQAPARDPGARVHASRRRRDHQGRCPDHCRHQRRAAQDDGGREVPRGSVLSPPRDHCAASRAA